jgi:DNA-binding winged helix-turn-helix (wHTH) protein
MTPPRPAWPIRFGIFEISPHTGELRKQGLKVKLGQQAGKLLLLLLERPGKTRTREELRQQLWPSDTFVDFEHSLNKAVHALRQALGDSASNPRYIETIAGQGYRFIPMAREVSRPGGRSRNGRKIESVAVLPLAGEPADPELEFLNKRIVERVIDTLSQTPEIRVLAYSTVQHHREKDVDPRTVGQNLHVRAVAAGEMVRRNDELLLHIELIDVDDGTQLWGSQFKELYSDVLDHPEDLADEICAQLRPILAPNRSRGKIGEIHSVDDGKKPSPNRHVAFLNGPRTAA